MINIIRKEVVTMTREQVQQFKNYLLEEEKASATIEKYIRDVSAFYQWHGGGTVEKKEVLAYKESLLEHYAPASVNSVLSSLNSFFDFCTWYNLKVKMLKIPKKIFESKEKELTKEEYNRLLQAAKNKNNQRLYYLMQTICSSGIRVSELKFVTVEAIRSGQALVNCKGRMRVIMLTNDLCRMLKNYAREQGITAGSVFVTRTGQPLDRSTIWRMMKSLCEMAGVPKEKVFPHNLRHLFARTYYALQKDIVRLADILGHSSINTTRIYTMETGEVHRTQLQMLGLLRL